MLAAGVGLALHVGPIIGVTFGVFFKPLSQEQGLSGAEAWQATPQQGLVNEFRDGL